MSVDYSAVLVIGREFDDFKEVVEFLDDHKMLSDDDLEDIYKYGNSYVQEVLYGDNSGLRCECLNAYRGGACYLGFNVQCLSIEGLVASVEVNKRKWAQMFPNQPVDVIHTVRVY